MWSSVLLGLSFPQVVAIRLAASLLLTLAVEIPIAAACGFRKRREVAAVTWVNVLTNPALVWLLLLVAAKLAWTGFIGQPDYARTAGLFAAVVAAVEAAAVIVEAVLLRWSTRRPWRRTFLTSLAMNASSFTVGLFLWTALSALVTFVIGATWPSA